VTCHITHAHTSTHVRHLYLCSAPSQVGRPIQVCRHFTVSVAHTSIKNRRGQELSDDWTGNTCAHELVSVHARILCVCTRVPACCVCECKSDCFLHLPAAGPCTAGLCTSSAHNLLLKPMSHLLASCQVRCKECCVALPLQLGRYGHRHTKQTQHRRKVINSYAMSRTVVARRSVFALTFQDSRTDINQRHLCKCTISPSRRNIVYTRC
jgi:hypothetical protein